MGTGLRNALNYAWVERILPATLRSYQSLHSVLGRSAPMALDVARLSDAFGADAFTRCQHLDLFRTLRSRIIERRWYTLAVDDRDDGARYMAFLRRRLDTLVGAGLIQAAGPDLRLAPRGEEAAHWLDLLVHSVDYPGHVAHQA